MSRRQEMDAGWLEFHPDPTMPDFVLPEGAVDAHCHVFGPSPRFPFAPERKYTPCNAGKEKLFALRDHLGFSRNVIVQATCHGKDNRAMADACLASEGRARGVATVGTDVTGGELEEMHEAGIRAVRFNFVKRLVDATPRAEFLDIAARIEPLGWHVVVYFEAADLEELTPFLRQIPTRVIVDHMGRPDVARGVDHPGFQRFLDLMADDVKVWSKVTCPERLSPSGPPYDDVVPFARTVIDAFPDRVLWGTDWPHPNMKSHMPDDGALVDYIPRIAPTAAQQGKLLVENPVRLYWE